MTVQSKRKATQISKQNNSISKVTYQIFLDHGKKLVQILIYVVLALEIKKVDINDMWKKMQKFIHKYSTKFTIEAAKVFPTNT